MSPAWSVPSDVVVSGLPTDFTFGVGSVALSIEEKLPQPSVWDVFAAAGRTADGSGPGLPGASGNLGKDVALATDLGVDAYRFSVAWGRTLDGDLGRYDELTDSLLAVGIVPWVTLYHWDLPASMMLDGGWLDRDAAARFADHAATVAALLGDRVAAFTTMSDPFEHSFFGHSVGIDAPGLALYGKAFAVSHHLMLGHAMAMAAIRSATSAAVGIQVQHAQVQPVRTGAATDSGHAAAATVFDALLNQQFTDPLFGREYPEQLLALPGTDLGVVRADDLSAIASPLDFYGVSYSHPQLIAAAPDNHTISFTMQTLPDVPQTPGGLPVHPPALADTLGALAARHELPPVYVTTGVDQAADKDVDVGDLPGHLAAVSTAISAGIDVRGHFARTLVDGWEFGHGYTRAYGLTTPDRLPRQAFHRYAEMIAGHRRTRRR